MTSVIIVLVIMFVAGVAIGVYVRLAPRAPQTKAPAPKPLEPWHTSTDWTAQAGAEFSGLAESARCDLVFAVADLNDERSQQLLLHALDDPSDAVALAAAHALAQRGSENAVNEYVESHPGERAQRISQTLALLT
jgi:HEAT repeat protein